MEFLNRMKFISYLSKIKFFIIFLLIGLLIFTFPMLKSHFDLMPGNGIDAKLFAYLLEHSRLWLLGVQTHDSLWDVPFYYPIKNTLAFSDALIGIMPIYWLIRIFFTTFSAIQVLMVVMCIFNYSALYYLFKKQLKFCDLASALGAFIFAFSILRYYRMVHLNYYCQFYCILALIFLLKINKNNSILKNNIFFFLFTSCMVLQFYSCYTLGYYFCIVSFLGILISLFYKEYRKNIFDFIKTFYPYIIGYLIFGIVLLIPFVSHYLQVGMPRNVESILYHAQTSEAWLRTVSLLDSFIYKSDYSDYWLRDECCAGIGFLTTIFALWGIWYCKKYKWILYSLLIFIFVASVKIFSFLLWEYLFDFMVGAQGIRVVVRIVYISLIIFSLGLSAFAQHFYTNFKNKISAKIILIVSVLLIVLEQIPYNYEKSSTWINYNWSKSTFEKQIEEASKDIPKSAGVIKFMMDTNAVMTSYNDPEYINFDKFHSSVTHLACFVALKTNKYCVNGKSGMPINTMDYESSILYTRNFHYISGNYDNEMYLLGYQKDL